jgi:hypothetical protein
MTTTTDPTVAELRASIQSCVTELDRHASYLDRIVEECFTIAGTTNPVGAHDYVQAIRHRVDSLHASANHLSALLAELTDDGGEVAS